MTAILGQIPLMDACLDGRRFSSVLSNLLVPPSPADKLVVDGQVAVGCSSNHSGGSISSRKISSERWIYVVADAKIFNRRELLDQTCRPQGNQTDADVILDCYLKWGRDCLHRIDGDFAFCVYDSQSQTVLLARDHIGSRPLFWTRFRQSVYFCSYIEGLFNLVARRWDVNIKRVAHYLMQPNASTSDSFFSEIYSVKPGHWLLCTPDEVKSVRWWRPESLSQQQKLNLSDAIEATQDLVSKAVDKRLPQSESVIGCHLSGGVDSSIIAQEASDILRARGNHLQHAFTWSPVASEEYPKNSRVDERNKIAALSRSIGARLHFGGANVDAHYQMMDCPMEFEGTADLLDELSVCSKAHMSGVTLILSGWGGDETLSNHGVGYLASSFRRGNLKPVFSSLRRHGLGLKKPVGLTRHLWRTVLLPLLPDHAYYRLTPYVDIYKGGAFISEDLRNLVPEKERRSTIRHLADPYAYLCSLLLSGHLGERMTTWACWAEKRGFEYRYPLTDRILQEFILSLPAELLFGDGAPRYLVRQAFKNKVSTHLAKHDPANEALRLANRIAWMQSLQKDAGHGRFDDPCPWLDMTGLRNAIRKPIPEEPLAKVTHFARIFVALRVYAMYKRLA